MRTAAAFALPFALLLALPLHGQEPTTFQYAAKFVCGTQPASPATLLTIAARGRYFSQTNVHNPSRHQPVSFRKKFAVAEPFERPGVVSPFFEARLQPDQALQIDCGDILAHLQLPATAYVEGFVVVESPHELDVDTLYSAGSGPASDVTSIHTERVAARRLPACRALNINLTTGIPGTPWRLVKQSSGPVTVAPPKIYGSSPVAGAQWIGGPITNKSSSANDWWEFSTCFCLCTGAQNVRLNLTGAAIDDVADVTLNAFSQIAALNWQGPPGTESPATLNALNAAASTAFRPGQNCLTIRLRNVQPNLAQLALAGTITGADALCPADPATAGR